MGMAASQARLLSITARIHDVEYQAQAIQNAKVQLSTQSDQVYQEYLDALSATTLTVTAIDTISGNTSTIPATFNNLCSTNRITPANGANYLIVDNHNRLILPDDVMNKYQKFEQAGLNDPYWFAMYMVSESNIGDMEKNEQGTNQTFEERMLMAEEEVYQNKYKENPQLEAARTRLEELLQELIDSGVEGIVDTSDIYAPIDDPDLITNEDKAKEYRDAFNSYKKLLYENYSQDIYEEASEIGYEDIDMSEFNYYLNLYKQIEACGGGVVSISKYGSEAGNNSEWLQNMITSGQIMIKSYTVDEESGDITLSTVNPSSDSNLSYTETSKIDSTAVAKAEAQYEHDLKQIDKKDKQYDMSLSKLESERSALTTEYDSVKKVISDNIERTFGIFS